MSVCLLRFSSWYLPFCLVYCVLFCRYQPSFHGVDLSALRGAAVDEYFRQPVVVSLANLELWVLEEIEIFQCGCKTLEVNCNLISGWPKKRSRFPFRTSMQLFKAQCLVEKWPRCNCHKTLNLSNLPPCSFLIVTSFSLHNIMHLSSRTIHNGAMLSDGKTSLQFEAACLPFAFFLSSAPIRGFHWCSFLS